ncbi:MAG: SusC/RagA family TonB-linked outer membrane protein [Bacteroidota bacterium]
MKKYSILTLLLLLTTMAMAQVRITGTITSSDDGLTMPGVNVLIKGTTTGTSTGIDGSFEITAPGNAILVFSSIGYETREVQLAGEETSLNLVMHPASETLDEVVVVGYGTQKKSDITGSVASLPSERLEQLPVTNVAQVIQGAIPGISITTNSAGAEQNNMNIMVRGRNSIQASNAPLIILDGIPYSGSISDIIPEDIKSIEVLKDASAAAIYGSRGSNGVILITSKKGASGKPTIKYSGYYGVQKISNMPHYLTGPEFYDFKNIREPGSMTPSEEEIYQNGQWTDWIDLAMQNGRKQQHSISVSGGTENVKYYISGTLLDVKGLAVNDEFKRYATRVNLETKITDWLTFGTNTQLSLTDRDGLTASWDAGADGAFILNPLTKAYEDEAKSILTIYPWADEPKYGNPLQNTLADNINKNYKILTNNYFTIGLPFIPGFQYRLNTGIEYDHGTSNTYYARDTKTGLEVLGQANTRNNLSNNYVVENIVSYKNSFGKHGIFITGLYSFQKDGREAYNLLSTGFTSDVLTWHQAADAAYLEPNSSYRNENLISQMLRVNYSYDSRYLLTITGRRDGFSGFGANRKWGLFPSLALGWNISNEGFFDGIDLFNSLKLRASYGANGNQAVGPYETLATMRERPYLEGNIRAPGYIPGALGNTDLGWEHSSSMNAGVDFGILKNRISGAIDVFNTNTTDLLLNRSVSSIHGITSVTQNIGATNNKGVELALNAFIVSNTDLKWEVSGSFSWLKNRIVSLYGELDEEGNEVDDVLNRWFIGQPIRVNYDRKIIGTWQLDDDIDGSAQPDAMPGYAKVMNYDGDEDIDADDRHIIGQRDPKTLWSLSNMVSYKQFTLTVFIHGITGVTRKNTLKIDDVLTGVKKKTIMKDWWTQDNPTNDFYANDINARTEGGSYYENASFTRLKDVSLSYDLPRELLSRTGFASMKVYVTGRNLLTITQFGGLDPELSSQQSVPLEKEFLVGLSLSF